MSAHLFACGELTRRDWGRMKYGAMIRLDASDTGISALVDAEVAIVAASELAALRAERDALAARVAELAAIRTADRVYALAGSSAGLTDEIVAEHALTDEQQADIILSYLDDPDVFDLTDAIQRVHQDDYEDYCIECGEPLDTRGNCSECDEDYWQDDPDENPDRQSEDEFGEISDETLAEQIAEGDRPTEGDSEHSPRGEDAEVKPEAPVPPEFAGKSEAWMRGYYGQGRQELRTVNPYQAYSQEREDWDAGYASMPF